jgi:hypothetical protein
MIAWRPFVIANSGNVQWRLAATREDFPRRENPPRILGLGG